MKHLSKKTGKSKSEIIRELLTKALNTEWFKENEDMLAGLIREQINISLKPHVERLAALSSKTGHMAATAAFLNIQAMQDLVPDERKRDLIEIWQKARKKAAGYMKSKENEWEDELDE